MKKYHLLWMAAVVLTLYASNVASAGQGTGLMSPTVCLSPAAFLVVAALPLETIVSVVQGLVNLDRQSS